MGCLRLLTKEEMRVLDAVNQKIREVEREHQLSDPAIRYRELYKARWGYALASSDFQESIFGALSNADKGTLGEAITKLQLDAKGFNLLGQHSGVHGIDSVWEKNGVYFIVESKFGSSRLGNTEDGRQGTPNWVCGRLANAFGGDWERANQIANAGYSVVVARINSAGDITMSPVDRSGRYSGHLAATAPASVLR